MEKPSGTDTRTEGTEAKSPALCWSHPSQKGTGQFAESLEGRNSRSIYHRRAMESRDRRMGSRGARRRVKKSGRSPRNRKVRVVCGTSVRRSQGGTLSELRGVYSAFIQRRIADVNTRSMVLRETCFDDSRM